MTRWAIVLAAGEGSRLRLLTMDDRGVVTPKQFCSLRGGASLLERTLARAERLVPRERIVVVVAAEHRTFWRAQLSHLPAANVVVQPRNRGTALGVLLPLLAIASRDPDPDLVVLPSDHFVADEVALLAAVTRASDAAARGEAGIVLVGMTPDAATSDYGWIVSAPAAALAPVRTFIEKPTPAIAAELLAQGALWNTFLFAARGRCLGSAIESAAPGVAGRMRDALRLGGDALERFYDVEPAVDLSRHVFERQPAALRVVRAGPCGWTDLGTPQRVRACLARRGEFEGQGVVPHRGTSVRLDLVVQGSATA